MSSRDNDTTTDLIHNDSSEQIIEQSTDTEIACEPMPQPPSTQSDNPSTPEINDPITETLPQNKPSHSRGGKYNLHPNSNPKSLRNMQILTCANF